MNGTDRRVAYTKRFLREALLELLREKPIGRITPTELCRRADVNRNTFYAHYSCPEELLRSIENELHDEIVQTLSEDAEGNRLASICRAIKQNADLCTVILSEHGDKDFLIRLIEMARDGALADWKRRGVSGEQERELLFSFSTHGTVAVINDWITGGMKLSPEELADFIERATGGGIASFVRK